MRGLLLASALLLLGATRSTTDFEMATIEKEIRSARDPIVRLAAQLNLGDFRAARGEGAAAAGLYRTALAAAQTEAGRARNRSDMGRYARATAYSGLALAKLGRHGAAVRALDEAMRYGSDSDVLWNLYASAMTVARDHVRAAAAASNAIALAGQPLDLAIYRYALATALASRGRPGDAAEAENILRATVGALEGPEFAPLRRRVAAAERFEVLSAARGEEAAYVALANRARLRLARVLEDSGKPGEAEREYRAVLRTRDDDPVALAGLARVASAVERGRYFKESFDASPFSPGLIRDYESYLAAAGGESEPAIVTTGDAMRAVIRDLARERYEDAATRLATLRQKNPRSDVINQLSERAMAGAASPIAPPPFLSAPPPGGVLPSESELSTLVRLLRRDALDGDLRASLDRLVMKSVVVFDATAAGPEGTTTFSSGSVGSVAFRFPSPTAFRGTFPARSPLLLDFRIAGVSVAGERDYLVIEPLGVSLP